jgi:hypothetical protein
MVDVAQLVEPRIVIPAVAGSNPVVHPTFRGSVGNVLTGAVLSELAFPWLGSTSLKTEAEVAIAV